MRLIILLLAGALAGIYTATDGKSQISMLDASRSAPGAGEQRMSPLPLPTAAPTAARPARATTRASRRGQSRGYQTTPEELAQIKKKAEQGLQPYKDAMDEVLSWADRKWDYELDRQEDCRGASDPAWLDEEEGTRILYAKALASHLVDDPEVAEEYAEETKTILERIMREVETINLERQQCQLNFSWNTPELVASADLIEAYWKDLTCRGPISTRYSENRIATGPCKKLFQNWLAKNPYYITSYAASSSMSNWGAAATNTTAYIADYLWDRPEVLLYHRHPEEINNGRDIAYTPAEAYDYANQLMFDRMNGYGVDYHSSEACDLFEGPQQSDNWPMVKSQITELGIIPDDARRDGYCNIQIYSGEYQNYPQVHLGNNIQQCELMLRRGDNACYENVDNTDLPDYTFYTPKGKRQTTHLRPGRGSIERAIKAIIVDSKTPWRHYSALEVAYRYYYNHATLDGLEAWTKYLGKENDCKQDLCFGTLTHGFAPDERPAAPPSVAAPSYSEDED